MLEQLDRKNVFVNDNFYDKIINGCEIKIEHKNTENCVIYCKNQLIGIGNIVNNILRLHTYLKENQ